MEFAYGLLSFALTIAATVWFVRFILRLRKSAGTDPFLDPDWSMRPAFSAADTARQLLLACGVALLQIGFTVFNQRMGHPVPYHALVLVFVAVFLGAAYRLHAPVLLAIASADAFIWWFTALENWTDTDYAASAAAGATFLGITLWFAGRVSDTYPRNERFAKVFWALGMLATTITLFFASTRDGLDVLADLGAQTLRDWRVGVSAVVLVVLATAAGAFAWKRRATHLGELAYLGVVAATLLVYAFFPLSGTGGSGTYVAPTEAAWALVFNALLLSGLVGLAFIGYARREDRLITLSAILLFVFVVTKYFDWLFSLLDRSVAFIGAGVILLGAGALMERGRRYALKALEAEGDE